SGDKKPESSTSVMSNAKETEEDVEVFGKKTATGNEMIAEYERRYENQLKEALEGIAGVSDVMVVVNVDATEKRVLEKNSVLRSQTTNEKDREGGERKVDDQSQDHQIVIIRDG